MPVLWYPVDFSWEAAYIMDMLAQVNTPSAGDGWARKDHEHSDNNPVIFIFPKG